MSVQVEAQLRELSDMSPATMRGAKSALPPDKPLTEVPPKQRKNIEDTTKEEAEHFLVKLADTAKNYRSFSLCADWNGLTLGIGNWGLKIIW